MVLEGDDRARALTLPPTDALAPSDDVLGLAVEPARAAAALGLLASPWGRRACRVAALLDAGDQVAAWAMVEDLAFRLDVQRLQLGAIGPLHVRPDLAAMGLERFFLVRIEEWLRSRELDGALLLASRSPRTHRRLGWIELLQGGLVADLREWRTAGPAFGTTSIVRPFEQRDFDAVRELWSLGASLRPFALLRDAEWWDAALPAGAQDQESSSGAWRFPEFPWGLLVAERDARLVAYLRTERRGPRAPLSVLEFAHEPGAREEITHMLRALLERLGAAAPKTLSGVTHSRLANLCPSDRVSWRRDLEDRLMIKSFSSFVPPVELHPDDRIVWPGDRAVV